MDGPHWPLDTQRNAASQLSHCCSSCTTLHFFGLNRRSANFAASRRRPELRPSAQCTQKVIRVARKSSHSPIRQETDLHRSRAFQRPSLLYEKALAQPAKHAFVIISENSRMRRLRRRLSEWTRKIPHSGIMRSGKTSTRSPCATASEAMKSGNRLMP